jgi:hypothetical protein
MAFFINNFRMPKLIITNSANLTQFEAKVTFDNVTNKIDIDTTGLVVAGVYTATVKIKAPDGSLLTNTSSVVTNLLPLLQVNLQSVAYRFGAYQFEFKITDALGVINTLSFIFDMCRPDAEFKDGALPMLINGDVNCVTPSIIVNDNTAYLYKGKQPYQPITSVVSNPAKTVTLYFPQETTISPIVSVFTPMSTNNVYTGDYKVSAVSDATYEFDNNIFVKFRHKGNKKVEVACGYKICDILCAYMELNEEYKSKCATSKGVSIKSKLDEIQPLFNTAMAKTICGKDASKEIEEIVKIGNFKCDCNCLGDKVEPTLLSSGNHNFTFTSGCGTTLFTTTSGNSTIVSYNSNIYVLDLSADMIALGYGVDSNTIGCTTTYTIKVDKEALATEILNVIAGDVALSALFTTLAASNTNSLAGLNMSCLYPLLGQTCNYTASIGGVNANMKFGRIKINGTWYQPPTLLSVTDVVGINAFLAGLGLGAMNPGYTYTAFNSFMNFTANVNNFGRFEIYNAAGTMVIAGEDFQQSACSVVVITDTIRIQAIIDFLCALNGSITTIQSNITTLQASVLNIGKVMVSADDDCPNYLHDKIDQSGAIKSTTTTSGVNCEKELFYVDQLAFDASEVTITVAALGGSASVFENSLVSVAKTIEGLKLIKGKITITNFTWLNNSGFSAIIGSISNVAKRPTINTEFPLLITATNNEYYEIGGYIELRTNGDIYVSWKAKNADLTAGATVIINFNGINYV